MEVQDSDGNVTKINSLVFVETTTNGVYKAKYKKSDGTLVEIPIEASQSVKLKTSRSIGINGLDAESASFNGTSAVKIKVTGVPAELLYGTGEIDITGNAASATEATHAASADEATNAGYATNAGTASKATTATYATSAGSADEAENALHADSADKATKADYATSAGRATSATSATNAKTLESSWTAYNKSNYLQHGTYLFQVVIDDTSSNAGGHNASFTDIITVNSYAYYGINGDTRYHHDYPTGANHVYNANAHEAPWYRTARLKVTSLSSTQFKIDLFVSSSGGYESTTTDINGKQTYPGTEASKISGITYQIYYKKIM
jgi:hypothetical protein